jgi:hypothetical protein
MLEQMNLRQYIPAFMEEQIAGDVFLALDDNMLKGVGAEGKERKRNRSGLSSPRVLVMPWRRLRPPLADDMGISNRLHRTRITKAIERAKGIQSNC